jgi:branched-chain amino acid transport system substrate-binding protein
MSLSRRTLIGTAAAGAAALPLARGRAQGPALKIGVLTDMSGPYKDLAGPGAVESARQALEDFGVAGKGLNVEVVSADHLNKTDVASTIARQWFDRDGVDIILECCNSGVALAVAGVAHEKNKVYVNSGAATSDLTGPQCNANTIHWVYDTYMLAKSTGGAIVKEGGNTWYFIVADYAFGHALQRDTTSFVELAGGRVLGAALYPFPTTTDFSSFILQAQASGAKVLGMATAGTDTINIIKQAHEFGITPAMRIAGLLIFLTDIHSIGLEVAQGLTLTESFYWDLDDGTRRFSDKFTRRMPGWRPSMVQAGVYSSALHYLKVANAMGIAQAKADGAATVVRMKAMPTDDDCFGKGTIRADGRKLTPAYLFEVKKPSESHGPWDYYKLLATTPPVQAYRPLNAGGCPLIKA